MGLALNDRARALSLSTPPPPRIGPRSQFGEPAYWHLFAGEPWHGGFSSQMMAAGFAALDFEKSYGLRVDFQVPSVRGLLFLAAGDLGLCLGAVMGPPCRSFSEAADRPCLRPVNDPMGLVDPPPEWRDYIVRENVLVVFAGEFCLGLHARDIDWLVENPAHTGDPLSPVHRQGRAHAAALFTTPVFVHLEQIAAAMVHVFPQCGRLGAPWRKLTGVMASLRLALMLVWLRSLLIPPLGCGCGKHRQVAYGVDEQGRSRSKLAARWPFRMVSAFVDALVAIASGHLAHGMGGNGGRVSEGPRLHPYVASACAEAREASPRFATLGSLPAATDRELDGSPVPSMPSMFSPSPPEHDDDVSSEESSSASETSLEEWQNPPDGPLLLSSIPKPGSWIRMLRWWDKAELCMREYAEGRRGVDPGECRVTQRQIRRFARGRVYDARDPHNVVALQPSTRHTGAEDYPGPRVLDRAAWRATAARHGWARIDPDILNQVGEGGCESRSGRPLVTRLILHHRGLLDSFEVAVEAIKKEFEDGVAVAFGGMCPFWPTGCLQRNVVWADRTRRGPGGEVEVFEKPRMTIDPSSGLQALNDTIRAEERRVQYPHLRQFTRGAAIVSSAARRAGLQVELYTCDVQAAFPHLILQRLDWVHHCFVWYCSSRQSLITGIITRVVFGGAYSPNRFCRSMAPIDAEIDAQIAAFDAAHPLPPYMQEWRRSRQELQTAGDLPPGGEQLRPAHRQRFVDDVHGSADSGVLRCPAHLVGYDVGATATELMGGVPAHPFCRSSIHLRIVLHVWAQHCLTAATDKTTCGSVAQPLGARVSVSTERIDCPPIKGEVMQQQVERVAAEMTSGGMLDAPRVATLTGRLTAISQFEPTLLGFLHGGYTVVSAALKKGRTGRRCVKFRMASQVKLTPGSRAFQELNKLLVKAAVVLRENVGVPWASPASFPPMGTRGVVHALTDASRASSDDGVGGLLFHPAFPQVVWLVSEAWPQDVKAALDSAARPRWQQRAEPTKARLSMPAAEVFGCGAVPAAVDAVTRASGMQSWVADIDRLGRRITVEGVVDAPAPVLGVYAIGDCKPAASAISKADSSVPQMRILVMHHRKLTEKWLGVQVPREFNFDADRLSHPSMLSDVMRDAVAAGLEPRVVAILPSSWTALREAMHASPEDSL